MAEEYIRKQKNPSNRDLERNKTKQETAQVSKTRTKAVHKGAYWISSNSSFIQYCDSNIGLFSIAPPLVIALPTLR